MADRTCPVIHDLKTCTYSFVAVLDGRKCHEVRVNDRDFRVGDILNLREFYPATESYSGRSCRVEVSYISEGGNWGLPEKLCVMSVVEPSTLQAADLPPIPDDLITRYRLAKAQLTLLPSPIAGEDDHWGATCEWCKEVIAFIERIAELEAKLAQARKEALNLANEGGR